MAGIRRQPREPLRRGQRTLRRARGLERVDQEVVGAGVVRRAGQHPLERVDRRHRAFARLRAVPAPPLPRRQHHQRLRIEHRDFVVVGELARRFHHRLRVGDVEGVGVLRRRQHGAHRRRGAVVERCRRGREVEPRRHRLDQCPLPRRDAAHERQRATCVLGRARVGGTQRVVDVRPDRIGDAPLAHRAARIEPRRLAEGAQRLGVVERIGQPQALVEELLRQRLARGDGQVSLADALDARRLRDDRRRRLRRLRAAAGHRRQHRQHRE
jgi:hypothetical protein